MRKGDVADGAQFQDQCLVGNPRSKSQIADKPGSLFRRGRIMARKQASGASRGERIAAAVASLNDAGVLHVPLSSVSHCVLH